MKKIIAKFNSKCALTNKPIKKGEQMYYDYSTRKCYCIDQVNIDDNLSDLIEAQENAYFDNFCINNNI
jgi:hypothetical protein